MSSEYIPTIGLEIHAELKTQTKMFCGCKNDTNETRSNINICPVCLGHPGTLPVINKEAIKNIIKVGIAVGGRIADKSEFDRKNYFYPDIPKGYQISQYKYPIVSGGELAGISLTRIHLEEDTASSSHDQEGFSLVDFNRAGVPLLELVTEPVIHDAYQVSKFGEELQLLLQYLGVSDANMEKGEMRLEANISVAKKGIDKLGTKVEIKNLNSFKSAERAVLFEIKRQVGELEEGLKIKQETRGWNELKQETFSQRSKEDSHDYRYFPDPDLPKIALGDIPEFSAGVIKKELKETPQERRQRLHADYVIKNDDIEFYIKNQSYLGLFENTAKFLNQESYQLLSNYIISDIAGRGLSNINPEHMASLISMLKEGEISSRGAKIIIDIMVNEVLDPKKIAEREGLFQKSDEESLRAIVEDIILNNKDAVSEYKNGKDSALQYLIGQGMKISKGSANPQKLRENFEKLLK